jgi:hypothetical protein
LTIHNYHGTLEVKNAGINLGAEFTINLPLLAGASEGKPAPVPVG